jgi:D-threo-aldose 1-dehydrogenase
MNLLREITLPNGRKTVNLGFGCAGILRLPMKGQRERLLGSAFDAGLTHFDVARMYGAGAAEGILGLWLRGKRSRVTLATKFGLPCGVPSRRTVLVQSMGRWAVNLHRALKQRMKQRAEAKGGDRHYDYSVEEMERSLETSLRELKTDNLDLFFLHEPRQTDVVPQELADALRRKQTEGKFGAFGISAMSVDMPYFFKNRSELCGEARQENFVLDAPSPSRPNAPYSGVFHVLSATIPRCEALLNSDPNLASAWSERLSLNLKRRENIAVAILAIALNENPKGMVLFFTSQAARIRPVVERLRENSFSSEMLTEFREVLRAAGKDIHAARS